MARPQRQEDLIAWLDDQEQKPFLRVAPIDETVEAFDPLHRRRGADDFAIPARIEEIYGRGQMEIRRKRCWDTENTKMAFCLRTHKTSCASNDEQN